MKVKDVLFFVLAVISILGIIMLIFPSDGIRISKDFTLYFPDFKEMFPVRSEPKIDIDSLLKSQINIEDIESDTDSNNVIYFEKLKKKITSLEFPENNPEALQRFFNKLSGLGKEDRIRIMHYGDSQIEGDRITADLRHKFQSKFGGTGIGLVMPVSIYAQSSISQSKSENWRRYAGFGAIDSTLNHDRYGPMIAFNRFAPVNDSAASKEKTKYSAWLEFEKSYLSYPNTALFKNVIIFYGNSSEKVQIALSSNGEILMTDTLNTGEDFFVFKYSSDKYLDNIKIEFEGYDSPDFYAISLEDDYGIYIDNIGLRGSSGDVFSNHDTRLLQSSYFELKPDLFILQFGGNIVPYTTNENMAKQFANYFRYHLYFLKNIVPEADFIVIGPSDMSTKEKDSYVTYPYLENIIDELRKASHDVGAVYWDTYKAMGGKNSMPVWVNTDPPLASSDYVHFTPQGSVIISNMFYNALMFDYQLHLKNKNRNNEKE
ncbi:MAG: hypothetical protein LBQ22_03410 [Bacteroidales bacterium]|jgi:lysophospholipase L1-like esterase|nr:hypothetical protein [Bacteroidales bacterium]